MSFLTNKYGPLPAWGWGAAAGGAVLLMKLSKGGGRPKGPPNPPGQQVRGTEDQSKGITQSVTAMGYGSLDSKIDASFFGNEVFNYSGPGAVPWLGISDYADIFPVGMGKDGRHPRHRHSARHRAYLAGVGVRDTDWGPTGAGGIGLHRPNWQGESAPAGGEGFQNSGQATFSGQRGGSTWGMAGGGGPHAQKTTMGTPLNTYLSQHGDTFDNVANKMWGPGMNGTLIHQANPGLAKSPSHEIGPGHMLNIPSAPPIGLAPSGVAGNGVGPGSWQAASRSRGAGKAMGEIAPPDEDLSTASKIGERPQPGRGGHGKRGGRGIQKARQ